MTVTLKPLYIDWDLGDGDKLRCFDAGTVYNSSAGGPEPKTSM